MSRPRIVRLDRKLVELGLAADHDAAAALILGGVVEVDGLVHRGAAAQIRTDQRVRLRPAETPWVSRGALKLDGVLDPLGVAPAGRICADLGASTGGFTEVLLRRGAARVYAVDVGRELLAWRLRHDPRVVNLEGTNARHLDALPEPPSLIVGDLSFISLKLILPAIHRLLGAGGEAVILVKPQFEASRDEIAPGGRVEGEPREAAIRLVRSQASAAGFDVIAGLDSPISGAVSGNVEHFLHLRPRAAT
jgi:23S rRNA (cytidine1920-2'-O)/16S rRNA (cytidine1409-2'-O)-methyltransferase